MNLICNNLTTKNPEVKEAVEKKDSDYLKKVADTAKSEGFNYLEIYVGDCDDEVECIKFVVESTRDTRLKYVIRSCEESTFEALISELSVPGILAPINVTEDLALKLFSLILNSGKEWGILFTQTYGKDTLHSEIEGMTHLISKAEQHGILPEFLYIEPLSISIATDNNCYIKMKRMVDAFRNMYPDINFYLNLPQVTEGLNDQVTLVNVFVGIADLIGVNSFAFNLEHKAHLQAIEAAEAILDRDLTITDYLEKY